MYFLGNSNSLQLDIVGIVAILGEGSILRNAQASALSWHHLLPRLIPAPQALLKHEQTKRLPTQKGIVSGVYSGNVRHELNFFTRLLHPVELKKYQIEVVKVVRNEQYDKDFIYGVNDCGVLPALSCLGCLMSCTLLGLSIWRKDGFAIIATVLLSLTSTIVGFASRWKLILEEENPQEDVAKLIPDGDVVIYYPGPGAIRVVRCDEVVSRLYFQAEECEYRLNDNWYRALAMSGSATLMFGLISLSNAHLDLQISFASAYIVLNALYWASSAYHERHHWSHAYKVTPIEIGFPKRAGTMLHDVEIPQQAANGGRFPPHRRSTGQLEANGQQTPWPKPSLTSKLTSLSFHKMTADPVPQLPDSMETFTDILWASIVLTRSTKWLRSPILPDTDVWEKWAAEATQEAAKEPLEVGDKIVLPRWDYKGRLIELFAEQKAGSQRRPKWPSQEDIGKLMPPDKPQPKLVSVVTAVLARMKHGDEQAPGEPRRRARRFIAGSEHISAPTDESAETE